MQASHKISFMLKHDFYLADAVSATRTVLADRSIAVRALDFLVAAAQASPLESRSKLLEKALETIAILVSIDSDDETCAAALLDFFRRGN